MFTNEKPNKESRQITRKYYQNTTIDETRCRLITSLPYSFCIINVSIFYIY